MSKKPQAWIDDERDEILAQPLNRDEALAALLELYDNGEYDPEEAHGQAELLLLRLIGDKEIVEAFVSFKFWYA